MNADNPNNQAGGSQQQQQTQPAKNQTTQITHPQLPAGVTLIEKIALPAVFAIVTSTIKNPAHAAELQEYMLALRDAIDSAYPDAD